MNDMRNFLYKALLLFMFFLVGPVVSAVFAGTLSFEPSSVNTSVGEEFTLTVQVDVGDSEVLGVDALLQYDEDILEVVSMTDGTFLSIGTKEFGEPGKAYIAGLVENASESVTGSGPLVDVTFKAQSGGTSDVTFVCREGETGESNISENSTDATDLIECSQNGEAVIVVEGDDSGSDGNGDGGGGTGNGGGSGSGSTPSELPQTGFLEDMVLLGMFGGGLLLLVGLGTRFFA